MNRLYLGSWFFGVVPCAYGGEGVSGGMVQGGGVEVYLL